MACRGERGGNWRRLNRAAVVALALALPAGCGELSTSTLPAPSDAAKLEPAVTRDSDPAEPLPKIEKPTLADMLQPGPLPERALGRADAPVTLFYYASLTCPYCRAFHDKALPDLKRQYVDKGQLRIIVREFPIGKTAGTATIATRCIKEARYFPLMGRYLAEQPAWVSQEVRHDAIFAIARKEGMTRAEYDTCLANQTIIAGLKAVKERGRQLGVVGTPGFFINEERMRTNPSLEDLKRAIDAALAKKAAVAKSSPG